MLRLFVFRALFPIDKQNGLVVGQFVERVEYKFFNIIVLFFANVQSLGKGFYEVELHLADLFVTGFTEFKCFYNDEYPLLLI